MAVSFKFTKSSKKNIFNGDRDENSRENEDDVILSIEGRQIESLKPKVEKKALVIPLIKTNNWRQNPSDGDESTHQMSLEEKAAAEIIEETKQMNENWVKESNSTNINYEIPLIMRNIVPEGFETDDKLDVSLRPEVSSLEDYENVPIDQFGLAVLRGMGWKKEEGIGGKNKQVIKPMEAVVRPKGLGLGADPKLVDKVKSGDMDKDDIKVFAKGGCVKVNHGPHRDLYAQIEGVDEDNSRVNLKMALSGKTLSLSKFILTIVSKKEYRKDSKVLNKEKYTEFVKRKDEEQKHEREKRQREDEEENHKKNKKKKSSKSNEEYSKKKSLLWVRPSLRVRFIDKKYRHGKFYNSKVIVEDVISANCCICQTDSGKIIEDIHPDQLETVIPKAENANVMIVGSGAYSNKVGKLIKRDKSKCKATIQLYDDNSVQKLHFDSVCEYVGDITPYL